MIGRRGSLRSSGDRNCKRFLTSICSVPSPVLRQRYTQSQATIALGGNFPSTFCVGASDQQYCLAKNERC